MTQLTSESLEEQLVGALDLVVREKDTHVESIEHRQKKGPFAFTRRIV